MQPSFSLLSIAALVTLASALPLNINLGAYSPALVVGDGAIEFEGEEAAEGRAVVAQPAGAAPPVVEAAAAPVPFAGPILNDNVCSFLHPSIIPSLMPSIPFLNMSTPPSCRFPVVLFHPILGFRPEHSSLTK